MNQPLIINDRSLLAVIAVSSFFLLNVILTPSSFDNAIVQSMALDLYRLGRAPFLGSWDQSFPGIVYVYYLAIATFGTSDLSFHIFEALLQLSFAIFLYRFYSRWLNPHTAALSAILYILYYVGANRWLYGTRDVYVGMSILAGLSFLSSKGTTNLISAVISGILCGCAFLLRPTSLLFIVIISSFLLFRNGLRPSRRNLLISCIFFIAALMPIGASVGYYMSIPNGIKQFYLATIRWNLDLYTKIPNNYSFLFKELLRRSFFIGFAIYALLNFRAILSKFFVVTPLKSLALLWVALLASALFIVILMGKFYTYHFATFFILMVPLSGMGIELVVSRISAPLRKHYLMVSACLLSTFFGFVPRSPLAFGLAISESRDPFALTYQSEYPDSLIGAKPELAIIDYLAKPENRVDPIEVCSYSPFLRLHLNRDFVGKYVVLDPIALRLDSGNSERPRYTSYQLDWQSEYIHLLKTRKPYFIIFARTSSWYSLRDPYANFLRYLPGFDSFLKTEYRKDTVIGGFEIYRRVQRN